MLSTIYTTHLIVYLSEVFPLPPSLTDNGNVSMLVLFAQYNTHYAFGSLLSEVLPLLSSLTDNGHTRSCTPTSGVSVIEFVMS